MRLKRVLLPVLLAATLLMVKDQAAHTQSGFALRDGDRVVFFGDSITEQQLYTTFVEEYIATRFPQRNISFFNAGWNGERVTGGNGGPSAIRLERDVIAVRPTVVTILLGMNDGNGLPFDPGLYESYQHGYQQIVNHLERELPGVRLTLLQPSPYDDVTRPPRFVVGYNTVLARYGEFVEDLARQHGAACADFNRPVVAALRQAADVDLPAARRLVPDRIHPAPGAHLVMATALLQTWDAPALVTAVSIDALAGQATRQENTHVSALRAGTDLVWMQQDEALPFAIDRSDPTIHLALRVAGIEEQLNQQPLVVTGLTAPRYTLKIDGEEIGRFTREEWAAGINLASLATPMARQAQLVQALIQRRNRVRYTRWRQVLVPLYRGRSERLLRALNRLETVETELTCRQQKLAQPQPHYFQLTPA
jgi:lysophospholipase L1-like esterase